MRILDLISGSGASWLPVIDAVLKATVIFAAASGASFFLRRRSAAMRHMIWTLALAAVLVVPLLSLALPRWQLGLVTVNQLSASSSPQLSSDYSDVRPVPLPHRRASKPAADESVAERAVAGTAAPAAAAVRAPLSWSVILLIAWTAGALMILGRLAAGVVAVQWMTRRTERVMDAPWLAQARALARGLSISPRILFLRSSGASMPMAWGVFRPAVLMPADADEWPMERLRIVLLHELAHVKRRDCLTHMLAQISCALYWFNPLAWMAARHVRTERERACDDLVLAAGTRGSDYADQLIEIARVMRSGRFPAVLAGASLAMAHRSELEGRLLAILDPQVPRTGLSRLRAAVATSMFSMALLPLASLQPWTMVPDEQAPATATQSPEVVAPSPAPQAAPVPASERASSPPVDRKSERAVRRSDADMRSAIETAVADGVQRGVATPGGAFAAAVIDSLRSNAATGVQDSITTAVADGVHSAVDALDVTTNVNTAINSNVHASVHPEINFRMSGGAGQSKVDPRTVAALTAALKDTDKDVRETAMHALAQLRDPGIFDPLVQALSDADADVREQAAFGLGQMRDRRAVQPLVNALKDQNADVREQAAFALGQLRDRSAVAGLSAALKDADDDVREQAVFALGQLRDPSAVDAIIGAVRDSKADVREQAVFALGQIRDRRAVEALISALKDSAADVRQQAAFALGQIRDGGAVEALVIALKDSAADVREQVAFALGQIRDPRAIDGLTAALKDASADVRQQAAFALGQLR